MIPLLTAHLWQSTFFALAVALLTLAFRKNRAQVRYWLWLSASVKFLLPFALLMSVGSALESLAPAAAHKIATPAVSYTLEQFGEPLLYRESAASLPPTGETIHWIPVALVGIWLCGFLTLALIRLRNWLRIRAAVRAGTATDIQATVEVRVSPGLLEPGVVGLLRPILLLPEGITERLTPSELKAVLAHEFCHIRRRDNLFAAIHMLVEAVFWFHPLVWWIGARLVEERERACDEEVLSQGNAADVYADAILNVCKLYVESPLACVAGVSGASIRRRIEVIMSSRRLHGLNYAKKLLLAVAGIAALAGPVTIGLLISVGHAPVIRAQAPTPEVTQAAPIQTAQIPAAQPKPAAPQPPPVAARPKFEAASIRPCDPNAVVPGGRGGRGGGPALSTSPGRLSATCMNVTQLIEVANGLNLFDSAQLRGGPAWARSDRYTIEAATDDPVANGPAEGGRTPAGGVLKAMLQTLLEDRFHLKIHRETEEIPIYALTVAASGLNLKPMEDGACIEPNTTARSPQLPAPDEKPECPLISNGKNGLNAPSGPNGPNWSYDFVGESLSEFANQLTLHLDRRVIDKTGVTGRFSFNVEFARDENAPGPTLPDGVPLFAPPPTEPTTPGPSIFTALRHLGLMLEPTKGPREYIVIDQVERPSEN